jgi:hypothetical protein
VALSWWILLLEMYALQVVLLAGLLPYNLLPIFI